MESSSSIAKLVLMIPCPNKYHISSKSKYSKDRVPVSMFMKDPSNASKGLFKHCLDCRMYDRNVRKKVRERHRDNHENARKLAEEGSKILYCEDRAHPGNSKYPRDKVPIELFRKIRDNPNSSLCKRCLDCREKDNVRCLEYARTRKETVEAEGKLYCRGCNSAKTQEEMHIKLNGEIAETCIECNNKSKNREKERRKLYNDIKMEFIDKHNCSCQRCKKIYLKPINEKSCAVRSLETYMLDGERMVKYEEKLYKVTDFIKEFRNILELRIIQLDHLTEKEQRERGILKPDELYVEKVRNVSNMGGEEAMRLEAVKCQHLCYKCHLLTTMEREKDPGNRVYTFLGGEKKKYIDNIKLNSGECCECGCWDEDLLRFFHLDHIDPKMKKYNVSEMVGDKNLTLDDVKEECIGTRVICGHCHIIHTSIQRKEGIVINVDRNVFTDSSE